MMEYNQNELRAALDLIVEGPFPPMGWCLALSTIRERGLLTVSAELDLIPVWYTFSDAEREMYRVALLRLDRWTQVRENATNDPNYRPYCLRCSESVRMTILGRFLWRCSKCGSTHDER